MVTPISMEMGTPTNQIYERPKGVELNPIDLGFKK
jgi:hypothetical protein